MGKTFAEKILASKAGLSEVQPGQIVTVEPDIIMSHDNSAAISKTFAKIEVEKVWNPDKIVIVLDHVVPAANETHAKNHQTIREFVAKQSIKHFHDIGIGVCHEVLPEKGHVVPGTLILGSDSHTTTYGAFGAFAAGIGRSETAAIWATGKLWLKRAEIISLIEDSGGEFSKAINKKTTHLVAADPDANTKKLKDARAKEIKIVGEDIIKNFE